MNNIVNKLPEFLIKELKNEYGEEIANKILNGYSKERITSLRVNTLKSNIEYVCDELSKNNIEFERVSWSDTALIIKNAYETDIKKLNIYENGYIYLQSLSSMLPPIILKPKENEDILDMTAAPGGKTTQIAAITKNNAHITACEINTVRADRLKYNIEKQGASSVSILKEDSRKLSNYFAFDKILLDAPCSGSGTIRLNNEKTYKNFSEKLIEKSIKSQMDLLEKALKILKPGCEMIYSTCSILKRENEEVIKKVLKGINAEVIPIEFDGMENIEILPSSIEGVISVCPNEYYDGFFITKIRKNKKAL